MADGRKNNGGARKGAGSPGFGKMELIKDKVKKHSPLWWKEWEQMMNGEDKDLKKLAFSEFNKLQTKMMPSTLEDEDGNKLDPIVVKVIREKE